MNADEFVSITRGLVRRGWTEIEPKVAASFATGGVFGILVNILGSYHVPITPSVQAWGPYLVAVIGGYLFPSSGQIIVTKADATGRTETTKTVGAVQTVVTGAIPVQSPVPEPAPVPRSAPNVPLSELLKGTNAPDSTDNGATKVNPAVPINSAETVRMYKP